MFEHLSAQLQSFWLTVSHFGCIENYTKVNSNDEEINRVLQMSTMAPLSHNVDVNQR